MRHKRTLLEQVHNSLFKILYGRSLLYNTCWEDPAVDRKAMALGPQDTVLVITSAGCNVLDYALDSPGAIHAVDANPRQTALLELKISGIRRLDFETFFSVFGLGHHPGFDSLYRDRLRSDLSPFARKFWDRHRRWFHGRGWQNSFFWHGLAGLFARLFRFYADRRPRLREALDELLVTDSIEEQRRIYFGRVEPLLWNRSVQWALRRSVTMCLLGVPYTQKRVIRSQHNGDLPDYIRSVLREVFRDTSLRENYFWTVYMRGHYTRDCCPEYLRPQQFQRLKEGLVDRIRTHTTTVTEFLRGSDDRISRFVLLDHMDWMSHYYPDALSEEWEQILEKAAEGARVIFRSGAPSPTFLDSIKVRARGGTPEWLLDRLTFDRGLARELSRHDRVRTYASFHIADLEAA